MSNEHFTGQLGSASGQAEHPAWLTELVSRAMLPEDFDRRCRAASKAAYAIDQLRRELKQHKLASRPFGHLIRGLAEFGSISLEDIQFSLGITDWDQLNLSTAKAFGRIAGLLKMEWPQVLECMKGAYAVPRGLVEAYPLGAPPPPFIDLVKLVEAHYNDEERMELEAIIRVIRAEYDQMG